jgi:hypothetical protein
MALMKTTFAHSQSASDSSDTFRSTRRTSKSGGRWLATVRSPRGGISPRRCMKSLTERSAFQ